MRVIFSCLIFYLTYQIGAAQVIRYSNVDGVIDSSSANQIYIVLAENYCKLCLYELNDMLAKDKMIRSLTMKVIVDSKLVPNYLRYQRSEEIRSQLDRLDCEVVFSIPNDQSLMEYSTEKSPYLILTIDSKIFLVNYYDLFDDKDAESKVLARLKSLL